MMSLGRNHSFDLALRLGGGGGGVNEVIHPVAHRLAGVVLDRHHGAQRPIVPGLVSLATCGLVGPEMARTFATASGPGKRWR